MTMRPLTLTEHVTALVAGRRDAGPPDGAAARAILEAAVRRAKA
jgi:hypothetical protein